MWTDWRRVIILEEKEDYASNDRLWSSNFYPKERRGSKTNSYFSTALYCPVQIFRDINKTQQKNISYSFIKHIVKHLFFLKSAFCTPIIRKLRTTQKRTKSIKDLDHYKGVFCYYCCYFKENNLHSPKRWRMRQGMFTMHSKKRNIHMATNVPCIVNMYPKTLKIIFGKQKKVLHSLILWPVSLQRAWSHTVKQDDNVRMVRSI